MTSMHPLHTLAAAVVLAFSSAALPAMAAKESDTPWQALMLAVDFQGASVSVSVPELV